MAPSTSKKNASASASAPAKGRHNWTYRQYQLCRVIIVDFINKRGLIEKDQRQVVADIFSELNPDVGKEFEWKRLVEHETTHANDQKAQDMHRAWRVQRFAGQPYTAEDNALIEGLREEIKESAAWKRYEKGYKERTGSDGEDVGRLDGSDTEYDAEHGGDEDAVEDDE